MTARDFTEIELETTSIARSGRRRLSEICAKGYYVKTEAGLIRVEVEGNRAQPAILTYHDIGMNSASCFYGFCHFADVQPLLDHFCLYHVNAPGQEEGSLTFSEHFAYPSLDDLAEALLEVMKHCSLRSFVGLGVGAGANILSRFAICDSCIVIGVMEKRFLNYPNLVDGLILVNCTTTQAGWLEWLFQKWNAWFLKRNVIPSGIEDYLLAQWFTPKRLHVNPDLVITCIDYLRMISPQNLGHFIDSYARRTDLGITRELHPDKCKTVKNFKCPVLLMTGSDSPLRDDTIDMNNRADPSKTTWIKFDCSGLVLEEQPAQVAEALLYFLQGLGYGYFHHLLASSIQHNIGGCPLCSKLPKRSS